MRDQETDGKELAVQRSAQLNLQVGMGATELLPIAHASVVSIEPTPLFMEIDQACEATMLSVLSPFSV